MAPSTVRLSSCSGKRAEESFCPLWGAELSQQRAGAAQPGSGCTEQVGACHA